ncbi:hypothetical protein KCQ_05221 [Pectobacterium atrosepticum ICMP 1526]|uniref:hypothetical protein n=1 Tax=Pectobacterium atrosepticum TaxID=29471 RepID=UPI000505BB17|nr:hypothetical protein [Pectobacterium atrosepticum]KFX11057.1 hypothetical protein JV34_21680 [Pectobacterium atrosepticum]KMK87614.1 hypothetical protein KCQ_05221 [Pectobacterium atrosepticum ICMP 1526]QXE13100.1 hypothetical protein DCX48_00490 [Pectobacterium atrosepticum]
MDEQQTFSLSYEQLTQLAETRIREFDLDIGGIIYVRESAQAAAILSFWYQLALNGYDPLNDRQRKKCIEADHERLKKLIWPEADKP